MKSARWFWKTVPGAMAFGPSVTWIQCVRGKQSLAHLAQYPEHLTWEFEVKDSNDAVQRQLATRSRTLVVMDIPHELVRATVREWLKWELNIRNEESKISAVLESGKKLGLLATLNLAFEEMGLRQRLLWHFLIATQGEQLPQRSVLLLVVSDRLEFSSDQEAETLRVQLVAMAKEQESMLYLASTRERPNKQWSSVDFRGYERSVTDEHPAQDELEEFENAA